MYIDKVCFEKRRYSVDEGDRIQVDMTLSRTLPYSLLVELKYDDVETKMSKIITVWPLL